MIDDQSPEFLEDMKQVLVRSGRNWEVDENGDIKFLLRKNMTLLARIWADFVLDTVFPSSHKYEVRWTTLVAIYCIIREHPMDVARIIAFKIYKHENMGGNKPRPIYPHLITSMVNQTWETSRRPLFVIEKRLTIAPQLSEPRVT